MGEMVGKIKQREMHAYIISLCNFGLVTVRKMLRRLSMQVLPPRSAWCNLSGSDDLLLRSFYHGGYSKRKRR